MKIKSITKFSHTYAMRVRFKNTPNAHFFVSLDCHSRQTLDYNPFRNLIEVSEHAFSARYIVADQNIQATSLL